MMGDEMLKLVYDARVGGVMRIRGGEGFLGAEPGASTPINNGS
jgi:hypothetical protein